VAVRTPSSYIPTRILTRGRGTRRPLNGQGVATRGYISGYAEGDAPEAPELDPDALISSTTTDSNGIQHLLSDGIVAMDFVEVNQTLFANPDREYTGYGANGFWYENGELDPTHVPFKASWAVEGEGDATEDRGTLDRFPDRIFVIATKKEVVIIDADTLDVWMRFRLLLTSPTGLGPFLGGPTIQIRGVQFQEGLLFVATNEGLRIAYFQNDGAFLLTEPKPENVFLPSLAWRALVNRNEPYYMDGIAAPNPAIDLLSDDCLSLHSETRAIPNESTSSRNSYTTCAIGHPNGLSAFALVPDSPLIVVQNRFEIEYILPWFVEDDDDPDAFSPLFRDSSSFWDGDGVRPGDRLTTDLGTEHVVTQVEQLGAGSRLYLEPELPLTATGASYVISRECRVVQVNSKGHLYFANGRNSVTVVRTEDWFTGATTIFSPGTFNTANDTSPLAPRVERINDFELVADTLYIATDLGVFRATDAALQENRESEFLYSTEAVTELEATFRILEGDEKEAVAVSADPETGNLLVAITEAESVVTEINPNIQQAFRFFNSVGRVLDLVSHRNPKGPPDVEVS
jgi:hypothetical protein